jgi:hypothetical protein
MFTFGVGVKRCGLAAAIVMMAGLGGCVTPYVDTSLKDLTPADKVQVANPQPVQLVFEFQTKGTANSQVTDLLKPIVLATVKDSGAFSQISDVPPANGALLHITLNNVELNDTANDAYAKGTVTGLTFGLIGNTVGDGYICTIDYLAGVNAPKITKTLRDAIYTSIGATTTEPEHAQKMKSLKEAGEYMTRVVIANGLNELAKDPAFAVTPAAAPAASQPAPVTK